MLDYILRSEIIFFFLGLCSILVFSISLERYFFFRWLEKAHKKFFLSYFKNREKDFLKNYFFFPGLLELLNSNLSIKEKLELLNTHLSYKSQLLEKRISLIGVIANISPLFGILGTIMGIILSLQGIEDSKENLLNKGIWNSLITTAIGLIISIPSIILHHNLRIKLETILLRITANLTKILIINHEKDKEK